MNKKTLERHVHVDEARENLWGGITQETLL
jgi:hypothetical protein